MGAGQLLPPDLRTLLITDLQTTAFNDRLATPEGSGWAALRRWAGLWAGLMALAPALTAHRRVTRRIRVFGLPVERAPGPRESPPRETAPFRRSEAAPLLQNFRP